MIEVAAHVRRAGWHWSLSIEPVFAWVFASMSFSLADPPCTKHHVQSNSVGQQRHVRSDPDDLRGAWACAPTPCRRHPCTARTHRSFLALDRSRRPRDGATRSACRRHRGPPLCDAQSSAGRSRIDPTSAKKVGIRTSPRELVETLPHRTEVRFSPGAGSPSPRQRGEERRRATPCQNLIMSLRVMVTHLVVTGGPPPPMCQAAYNSRNALSEETPSTG
jgi:hypothetical protein